MTNEKLPDALAYQAYNVCCNLLISLDLVGR